MPPIPNMRFRAKRIDRSRIPLKALFHLNQAFQVPDFRVRLQQSQKERQAALLNHQALLNHRALLRQQIEQHKRRLQRIEQGKRGEKQRWLICSLSPEQVPPCDDPVEMLKAVLGFIEMRLPKGLYRFAIQYILRDQNASKYLDANGVFHAHIGDTGEITAIASAGLVYLKNPSRRLKLSLSDGGIASYWNYRLSSVDKNEDHPQDMKEEDSGKRGYYNNFINIERETSEYQNINEPAQSFPEDIHEANRLADHSETESLRFTDHNRSLPPNENIPGLQKFWDRYGRGKGTTIVIIDSGVCKKNTDIKDRLIYSCVTENSNDLILPDNTGPTEFSHGTKMASIAAGIRHGIATEANIVSCRLSSWEKSHGEEIFNLRDLSFMLAQMRSHIMSNLIERVEQIDVILISLTVAYNKELKKAMPEPIKDIVYNIFEYQGDHKSSVVAAVGNEPSFSPIPANVPFVISVGACDDNGDMYKECGIGKINIHGGPIPNLYFRGVNIPCETINAVLATDSGTSVAAAGIAGILAIITAYLRDNKMPNTNHDRCAFLDRMAVQNEQGMKIVVL